MFFSKIRKITMIILSAAQSFPLHPAASSKTQTFLSEKLKMKSEKCYF